MMLHRVTGAASLVHSGCKTDPKASTSGSSTNEGLLLASKGLVCAESRTLMGFLFRNGSTRQILGHLFCKSHRVFGQPS